MKDTTRYAAAGLVGVGGGIAGRILTGEVAPAVGFGVMGCCLAVLALRSEVWQWLWYGGSFPGGVPFFVGITGGYVLISTHYGGSSELTVLFVLGAFISLLAGVTGIPSEE